MPSFPVQLSHSQGFKLEVIREEMVNHICTKVFIYNNSETVRILQRGQLANQSDDLVRNESGRLVHFSIINDLIKHIVFKLLLQRKHYCDENSDIKNQT